MKQKKKKAATKKSKQVKFSRNTRMEPGVYRTQVEKRRMNLNDGFSDSPPAKLNKK